MAANCALVLAKTFWSQGFLLSSTRTEEFLCCFKPVLKLFMSFSVSRISLRTFIITLKIWFSLHVVDSRPVKQTTCSTFSFVSHDLNEPVPSLVCLWVWMCDCCWEEKSSSMGGHWLISIESHGLRGLGGFYHNSGDSESFRPALGEACATTCIVAIYYCWSHSWLESSNYLDIHILLFSLSSLHLFQQRDDDSNYPVTTEGQYLRNVIGLAYFLQH